MRFLHISDLHFGKTIHGVSMLESGDQAAWVEHFLELTKEVKPDAVVIAGDVYDRSTPSGDAVQLLDYMLMELSKLGVEVVLVAGNHDSGQRLSFASQLLARQRLNIAGVLPESKTLNHVTLQDEHGSVTFWLMPYVFPALVARVMDDDSIRDYDRAVRRLLEAQDIDFSQRNVMVAHQNVTAAGVEAIRGGSESMVGGLGQIDYTAFDGFDYVALGHIHSGYHVGRETVRYAGTPICYHFDETKQTAKGPVLVTMNGKGDISTETMIIPPLHPMREIRGRYDELIAAELENTAKSEYLKVVLTDRRTSHEMSNAFNEIFEARGSRLLEFCSDYKDFNDAADSPDSKAVQDKAVEELFTDFYAARADEQPADKDLELLHFAGEQMRNSDTKSEPDKQDIDKLLSFLMEQEVQS